MAALPLHTVASSRQMFRKPGKDYYTMITNEPNRENTKVFESEILPSIVLSTSIGDSKSIYFPR
jgi:hypothetical protein